MSQTVQVYDGDGVHPDDTPLRYASRVSLVVHTFDGGVAVLPADREFDHIDDVQQELIMRWPSSQPTSAILNFMGHIKAAMIEMIDKRDRGPRSVEWQFGPTRSIFVRITRLG